MRNTQLRGQQSGFTLIELVVVIVILGILAATAIPRFADMSTDARVAKMRAAQAAIQTGSSLFHAQWLVAGSPAAAAGNSTSANSVVVMEGTPIAFINGYPDVGGDGSADSLATAAAMLNSGIAVAAGGLADYDLATSPTADTITIAADAGHPNCSITYTQATPTAAPVINAIRLDPAPANQVVAGTPNCQ